MNEKTKYKLPPPIIESREMLCPQCSCGTDKNDPCAFCPHGRWKEFLCHTSFAPKVKPTGAPPTIKEMVKSVAESAKRWANSGFKHSSEDAVQSRLETCQSCEFWNGKAINGTGRCMKCGCSTWAKIRMATESCPIGKWGPEPTPEAAQS